LFPIAADPKHLGAEIGFFAVLHSGLQGIHAKEHTAQVPNQERQLREDAFCEKSPALVRGV
jgi:hypothetical protein